LDVSRPEWLWLLIPWSLFLGLAWLGRRRRVRNWRALGQGGRPPGDGAMAATVAALLLIVGMAQPRWGNDPASMLPPGRDVVLLIDVSRSMGAEDAVPNRLGVAIESARGLLEALAAEEGDRVALVAFAGSGVVRCGLTENLGAAMDVIKSLRTGTVQPGGTDIGAALEVAAGAFDDRDHADGRMIVVFTDGEDLAGGWRSRVEPLRKEGIIINAVAIGDPDTGHPVPSGEGGLVLSYQGKPVISKRSDESLDALAGATGGAVIRLGLASADMGVLYRDKVAPAARRLRHATHPPERAERFGVFVLGALMVLLMGTRPRASRRSSRRWGVLATAALAVTLGAAPSSDSPRQLVERGRLAYAEGRLDEALAAFEVAAAKAPRSPVPRFGVGAALFALGRYPEANAAYGTARDLGDEAFRVKVDYALGNAALMAGDPATAIRHYDSCIASTKRSRPLDAIRRDAEANRDYALLRLNAPSPPESQPEDDKAKRERSPEPKQPPPGGQGEGEGGDGPRGQGGAGGSEPDPRPRDGMSPQEQLDAALEHVREALEKRLPDVPVQRPSKDTRDW
jgi:Ca-activated chloride channel family protein